MQKPRMHIFGDFFALGQAQGGKPAMEDRFFLCSTDITSAAQAQVVLNHLFAQADHQTNTMYCGTTASVVILTPDGQCTIGHVGDSPAMLFWEEAQGQVCGKDLVKPHNLDDEEEKRRVLCEGGQINAGRVSNIGGTFGLEMTRSLGDPLFVGVSHEPTINTYDLVSLARGSFAALLCVCSDGFVSFPNPGTAQDYVDVFFEDGLKGRTLRSISMDFVNDALENKKSDNLTLALVDLKKVKSPLALGVFDGHGGVKAANQARAIFHAGLSNHKLDYVGG